MELTLGPLVLNSIDLQGKDDINIFVLMTWTAASSTSRGILHSSVGSKISLDDLFFFRNFFNKNNYKEATNIGGGQIRDALFNCFGVKKYPFCIFRMLSTVSKKDSVDYILCCMFYKQSISMLIMF